MRESRGCPPRGTERRQGRRWLDKRLVTVQTLGGEYPGMTGDLSLAGLRIGLPCAPERVGRDLEICVAFAQELLTVRCQLVYARERGWGSLIGACYAPGQELFRRFLARRYPPAEESEPTDSPRVPAGSPSPFDPRRSSVKVISLWPSGTRRLVSRTQS